VEEYRQSLDVDSALGISCLDVDCFCRCSFGTQTRGVCNNSALLCSVVGALLHCSGLDDFCFLLSFLL